MVSVLLKFGLFALTVVLVSMSALAQPEVEPERDMMLRGDERDAQEIHKTTAQTLESFFSWDKATGNWWGVRRTMEEHGVFFNASLVMDVSTNFSGGLERGTVYRQLLDINLAVETQPLVGWEGGRFYISFNNYAGGNGTDQLVGDLQGFDNLDAYDFTALYELWYSQSLFEDLFVLTVGKLDANALFAYVEAGGLFINSSAGFPPTIVGFPSYPDPAMSVNLEVNPVDWLRFGVGFYDGSGSTGTKGPATFFHNEDGYFIMGEASVNWDLGDRRIGRLAAGGWGHTGTFERFDSTTQSGTEGFYVLVEQTVMHIEPEVDESSRRLDVFLQYGYADPELSEIAHFIGGGLTFIGPIPGRENDQAGFYVAAALLSDDAGFAVDHEVALETTYQIAVTPFFSIQPSLQYIFNPGGASSASNSLVGTLRFVIDF